MVNKYCLGVELAPMHQVIKKLKIIICGSTSCILHHAAMAAVCDKKQKQKEHASY